MTEDEAKTKWCPFARVGTSRLPGYTYNRDGAGPLVPASARCIGSACMAWRESLVRRDSAIGVETWVKTNHCGLAGVPQ